MLLNYPNVTTVDDGLKAGAAVTFQLINNWIVSTLNFLLNRYKFEILNKNNCFVRPDEIIQHFTLLRDEV